MEFAILKNPGDLDAVTFVPNLAVAFYQQGKEEFFIQSFERLKSVFPGIDVIGCSGESLIDDALPHYDPGRNRCCVIMLLKMQEEKYAFEIVQEDADLPEKMERQNHAIIISTEHHSGVEKVIASLQQKLQTQTVYGAIASSEEDAEGKASLFVNGRFYHSGHLLWLIDKEAYALNGTSIRSFEPVEIELTITAVDGCKILEIDNGPALEE